MIANEGGFKLHNTPGDRGGQTYAGISRIYHPDWEGWALIDRGDFDNPTLTRLVVEFYYENFWVPVGAHKIENDTVAFSMFDFAVNAGIRTAVKLAQITVGATPDGIPGPKTLRALNSTDSELFRLKYALSKVARYADIVNRDRSQSKFLLGWINRTLKELDK